ncbi:MAG: DUF4388 domain-containing protein [candidate division Zixibacteria bacterium]|nr:DUF4388 domain-containing protein [candidate division Zixibacteria bacterium]
MDIEKNGELEKISAAEVFAAIHRARAYGVVHFKGPEGETVFVTFKRGLAQHASGKGGEGEAAVKAVLGWREGEYRFIEDVIPADEDFPTNVPDGVADALAAGKLDISAVAPPAKVPPLPVLPAGEPAGQLSAEAPAKLLDELEKSRFTGCCTVGSPEGEWSLFLFIEGAAVGGLVWDCDSFRRGEEAWPAFEKVFGEASRKCELYRLAEEAASAIAVGLSGHVAVARMPSSVINIEEYLSWAGRSKITGLISIIAGERAANILIKHGKVLGAVVAPDTRINDEPDEALALHYTPGANVEAYATTVGML